MECRLLPPFLLNAQRFRLQTRAIRSHTAQRLKTADAQDLPQNYITSFKSFICHAEINSTSILSCHAELDSASAHICHAEFDLASICLVFRSFYLLSK